MIRNNNSQSLLLDTFKRILLHAAKTPVALIALAAFGVGPEMIR